MNEFDDLGNDLTFTRLPKPGAENGWVRGTLNGHRFDALVFRQHADNPAWELGESRISKLWVQRLADRREVFNWDRGPDVPPADATAAAIVAFLEAGLADAVFE